MKTGIVCAAALFGAGAIAHPHAGLGAKHVHLSPRDPSHLIDTYVKGNEKYEVYEVVETKVGTPPPAPTPAPAPAPVQVANNNNAAAKEKDAVPAVVQPVQSSTAPPAAANTASSPSSSSGDNSCPNGANQEGGPAFSANSCSDGQNMLDTLNTYLAQWHPDHPPYTFDSTLAQNALLTTTSPNAENGAMVMKHALNPGSLAQCIASGNGQASGSESSFAQAVKMWMCEIPSGKLDCSGVPNASGGDTGHAQIIMNTAYTKVGCYFLTSAVSYGGMFTCDFA